MELIFRFEGSTDDIQWYSFVKGRRKVQKYLEVGKSKSRLEISWEDILYTDIMGYTIDGLKQRTCSDIDNNLAYSYLRESVYYYYWKCTVVDNTDYPDKDMNYLHLDGSSSAPTWMNRLQYKRGLATIDFKECKNYLSEKVSSINVNKIEDIKFYYKASEENLNVESLFKQRYLYGSKDPIKFVHLYDSIYYLDDCP
jgi:hypothetical protein